MGLRGVLIRSVWLPVVVLGMSLSSGCQFSTKRLIPDEVRAIHIPVFANQTFTLTKTGRTFRRDVDNYVTDFLIREFLIDGTLDVVAQDQADWVLEGSVIEFKSDPLRYADINSDIVEEFRITLAVALQLTDMRSGKVLWKDEIVKRTEDFYVGGTVLEEEDSAVRQASERLAKDIFIQVMEGWYPR